ncbi:MAG: FAD-dependent oxidoreductase [Candidatus Eisenbacteria bacterium]|uniref:FAD-dependent oxidoreductase n=1 Tax=Eiseniibacteriota bacterium TaxID=2212470 RepID=A0A956RQC4_UNCEI|nr:FAD-dependent oxidoreductase [Candidatus Eisenbacteria bacterium]
MNDPVWDYVIVGGGLYGLSVAYALAQLAPGVRICLLDQFPDGHENGSSHGITRVTRTTYDSPPFVELARRAHRIDWPELERAAGEPLIVQTGGLFSGEPGGGWDDFERTMAGHPEVERLPRAELRSRFPLFRDRGESPLFDSTAGVIRARRTLDVLRLLCDRHEIDRFAPERVLSIDPGGASLRVRTERRTLVTGRIVIATGAWTTKLLPELGERLRVVRQTVLFLALEGPPGEAEVPAFPVWVHVGRDPREFFYGIGALSPDRGIKIARHDTVGEGVDPDLSDEPDPAEVEAVLDFAAAHFARPVSRIERVDRCLYTMTEDEYFLVGPHPGESRITLATGFSGHGFKFAPLIGRVAAEIAWSGETSVPEFRRHAARFLPR